MTGRGPEKEVTVKEKTLKKAPYVIVRTYTEGVHVGVLGPKTGEEFVLTDARRVRYWQGANTLHEMSLHGLTAKGSKVSEPVPKITVRGWIEILPRSEEAEGSLRGAAWTK